LVAGQRAADPPFHGGHLNDVGRKTVALTLNGSSFKEGERLKMDYILSADYGFGCGGGNKSPHLAWSGAPARTDSFAKAGWLRKGAL
jgi:hypothetical protein